MRKVAAKVLHLAARVTRRLGLTGPARRLLGRLLRRGPRDPEFLRAMAKAAEVTGDDAASARYRAERLRHLMPRHLRSGNLIEVLELMAEMERTGLAAQFSAGKLLADQLVTAEGRARLLEAAQTARGRFQESVFLSHLITLCQAMGGDHVKAGQALAHEIKTLPQSPEWLKARRFRLLEQSWRVVDLIARESMDWSDDAEGYENLAAKTQSSASLPLRQGAEQVLSFKEHALQGRLRETYLEICDQEFSRATELQARLAAIEAMLRTSIRHIPDYSAS